MNRRGYDEPLPLLDYWLLTDAVRWEVIVFSCVSGAESSRLRGQLHTHGQTDLVKCRGSQNNANRHECKREISKEGAGRQGENGDGRKRVRVVSIHYVQYVKLSKNQFN